MSFHDKLTKGSHTEFVYIEQRGEKELIFEFEALEDTSCRNNMFELDLVDFIIEFVDESLTPSSGVYIRDRTQLVVDTEAQKELPVNTDILILIKADWFGELTYSIVYKIRFNTNVNLEITASTLIVPIGQPLDLTTSDTQIVNYVGREAG